MNAKWSRLNRPLASKSMRILARASLVAVIISATVVGVSIFKAVRGVPTPSGGPGPPAFIDCYFDRWCDLPKPPYVIWGGGRISLSILQAQTDPSGHGEVLVGVDVCAGSHAYPHLGSELAIFTTDAAGAITSQPATALGLPAHYELPAGQCRRYQESVAAGAGPSAAYVGSDFSSDTWYRWKLPTSG